MQDQTAIVREAAVASLLAYGTLAGTAVESERVDQIDQADMPRLVLYADESSDSNSKGGTAPAFDVTMTLMVQALVYRARKPDAVADLDTLIAQVKDCLFGDPAWVMMTQNIASVATTRSFKAENDRIVGDGRIKITCTWIEVYPPRVTQPLTDIRVNDPAVFDTVPPEIEFDIPLTTY